MTIQADVSDAGQVRHQVENVYKELVPIGILVNNAGIIRPQPITEITEKDWDDVVTVNLQSMFLVTQVVLPAMRRER